MIQTYSKDPYECPHCFFREKMLFGDTREFEGVTWYFYRCICCSRWVAIKEGEEPRKLFDLPFLPLNLNNPL